MSTGGSTQVDALMAILSADDRSAIGVNSFAQNMRRAKGEAQKVNDVLGTAGARANRQYVTGLQQAGYQVGDFAVQVAAGQSAILAFTQQGSQMLGVFGKWGAVGGAALAIVGGIAYSFIRARGESLSFEDALDALNSAADETRSSFDDMIDEDGIAEEFGVVTEAIREALRTRLEMDLYEQRQAADAAIGAATRGRAFGSTAYETISGLPFDQAYTDPRLRDQIARTAEDMGLTVDELRDLAVAADGLASAQKEGGQAARDAAMEFSELLNSMVNLTDEDLNPKLREMVDQFNDMYLTLQRAARTAELAASIPASRGGVTDLGDGVSMNTGVGLTPDMPNLVAHGSSKGMGSLQYGSAPSGISTAPSAQAYADSLIRLGNAASTASQGMGEMSRETRDVKSALDSMFDSVLQDGEVSVDILNRLGRQLLKRGVYQALSLGLPSLFGGAGIMPLLNADGNVFSGGRVTPFARGGVVSGATAFPMPSGMGLMGEAGPEAIMPLTRVNGKLGVQSGGGTQVHIHNHAGVEVKTRESGGRVDVTLSRAVGDAIASGAVDRQAKIRWGVKPRGQG